MFVRVKKITNDDIPLAYIFNSNDKVIGYIVYKKGKSEAIKANENEYFFPYYYKEKNQSIRLLICGAQGSGKSFYLSKVLDLLTKREAKDIIFLSENDYDESIDKLRPSTVLINNEEKIKKIPMYRIKDNPDLTTFGLDKFKNSYFVTDDIENIDIDKEKTQWAHSMRDLVLTAGRKRNIDCMNIIHSCNQGMKSQILKLESNNFVIYPQHSSQQQIRSLCDKYIGVKKQKIDDILQSESRFVNVSSNYPRSYISLNTIDVID